MSGRNITMNSGVSLERHKITELMHNDPPTTAITGSLGTDHQKAYGGGGGAKYKKKIRAKEN